MTTDDLKLLLRECYLLGQGSLPHSLLARIDAALKEPSLAPAAPHCNEWLRENGKPYPRTCVECKLGPCRTMLAAIDEAMKNG